LKAKLVAGLVLYLAHYPEDAQYAKDVERHAVALQDAKGLDAQLARGAHAAMTGKTVTVYRELSPLTQKRDYEYMANLLLGVSATFALRTEGELPPVPAAPPVVPEKDADAGAESDAAVVAGGEETPGSEAAGTDGKKPDRPAGKEDKGEKSDEMDFVQEMAKARAAAEKEWRQFAMGHLKAAAEVDPTAPAPKYWMGVHETGSLEPKRALGSFNKLLQSNPTHVPGLLALSHLSYLAGDLDAARSHAAPVAKGLGSNASKRERSEAHMLIGLIAQARRKSEDARTSLVEALSIDPKNTRALKALGQEFERNRKYQEALTYFTTNEGLSQKDPEVMIGIVTSLLGLERREDAMKRLEEGIAAFPDDPRFAFHLARIHAQQGQLQFARANYEKAITADEGFHRAYVALALLTVQSASGGREDQEKAMVKARELLQVAEDRGGARDAEVAVELGEAYMLLGDRKRSLSVLKTALRVNASNLDARMGLARYYLKAGEGKKAAQLLKPFEDSDVEDIELKLLLARVYRGHGQYEKAVDFFDQLIEGEPESSEYLYERGLTYFMWENFATAREDFLNAYKKDPKRIRAYFYVGRVHLEQNQPGQAVKVFRSVLDESAQVGEFRFYFAYALEKNRNLAQALEEYRAVDRYDSEYGKANPELYYRRGRIYYRQGNHRRAKQDLKLALTYNPQHVGALLTLADTIFNEGDYELAISLYERALTQRKDLANAHYRLGLSHGYLSNRSRAIREFEKAISLGLKGRAATDARRKLGYQYRDSGNRARAVKHFQAYLKLMPDAGDKAEIEGEIRRLGGRVPN
jgi:tetratricopeptide (TPR) repeat protein